MLVILIGAIAESKNPYSAGHSCIAPTGSSAKSAQQFSTCNFQFQFALRFSKWPDWMMGGLGSTASHGMGVFSSFSFFIKLSFVSEMLIYRTIFGCCRGRCLRRPAGKCRKCGNGASWAPPPTNSIDHCRRNDTGQGKAVTNRRSPGADLPRAMPAKRAGTSKN